MFSAREPRRGNSGEREMSFNAERVWGVISGLSLVVAAIFLWRNNLSAAFVTATLGVVAWFLSYRAQISAKTATETESEPIEDGDED